MRCVVVGMSLLLLSAPVLAAMQVKPVEWKSGPEQFRGMLVYDDAGAARRPGLVMVPNWLGVTDAAIARARDLAGSDYVVLVADMYGKGVRPKDGTEALVQVRKVYADRGVTVRRRVAAALEALKAQAGKAPLDTGKLGALGFCFGGSVALELARSGADVAGVASVHGDLETYQPAEAGRALPPMLVLNGAADTSVSTEQIVGFGKEMDAVGADWQFVNFSGARHCFSQPESTSADPGNNCQYHERSARRAFEMLRDFFRERFAAE